MPTPEPERIMPKIYDAKNRSYREVNEYEHRLLMGRLEGG
jgi:hypothetical protein